VSLQAFTVVYDRIIPDQERHYAGLVAKHLDIPIEFSPRDAETSTPWVERCAPETPEPVSDPFSLTFEFEFQKRIASRCRVFLYGEGPDNALKCDWRAHLNYLVQQRRWGRLLPDFWYHVVGHPRIPYVGRIANWSYERARRRFPPWLNEDFARRFRLRERWGEDAPGPPNPHPTRPTSYGSMSPTIWQPFLDGCDLLGSRTLSEFVHPYLDLRFLRFLLAVPAIPWCCNKNLSRLAMRSSLPDPVLRRPKSPITKDPLFERACLLGMPKFPITESFSSYVIPGLVPEKRSASNPEFWADMRAISLAHWLSKSYGAT
jgi:asparagine synthase (glutamine-hydrolysing)